MSFPQNVRTEALVLAARHCSVCHRYKGVKVEVHHIVQEAHGGENTIGNAITLCFDCHADAGHYNPQHPRGTKFSPEELRKARDAWHMIVKMNGVETPKEADDLYCRYVVCKDFNAIVEIADGNLADFPVTAPLLVKTPPLNLIKRIVSIQGREGRLPRVWGGSFQTEAEYLLAYPDAAKTGDTVIDNFHYWEYQRRVTVDELKAKITSVDYPSAKMFESGLSVKDICSLRAYTDECGGVALQEEFSLRPVWAVFLAVTNVLERRVRISALECQVSAESESTFAPLSVPSSTETLVIPCPAMEVPQGSTIIFPIAVVLGPIHYEEEGAGWSTSKRAGSGAVQEVIHATLTTGTPTQSLLWGHTLSQLKICFDDTGTTKQQATHEFDLENVYIVNRYWASGSCPHVFAVRNSGTVSYLGEVFVDRPLVRHREVLNLESDIALLVIAELEDERTLIDSIAIDGYMTVKDLTLEKGDFYSLRVGASSEVVIEGRYELYTKDSDSRSDRQLVRQRVRAFAADLREYVQKRDLLTPAL